MAIFTRDGTPLREALYNAGLILAGRTPQHLVRNLPPLVTDGRSILQRYVKDRIGDIIRITRAMPLPGRQLRSRSGAELRAARAHRGVGRPPEKMVGMPPNVEHVEAAGLNAQPWNGWLKAAGALGPMHEALKDHGSQRAAARALGIALSTFQRRLAKEAAAQA